MARYIRFTRSNLLSTCRMKLPEDLEHFEEDHDKYVHDHKKDGIIKRQWDFFKDAIISLVTHGLTPTGMAWGFSLGFIVGTFPIPGTHTIMGIVFAYIFRLNQVAVYISSLLAFPFFIIMLIPSLRFGEFIFNAPPLRKDVVMEGFERMGNSFDDFKAVMFEYGEAIFHMLVGWIPLVLVCAVIVYIISYAVAIRVMKKYGTSVDSE